MLLLNYSALFQVEYYTSIMAVWEINTVVLQLSRTAVNIILLNYI